MSDLSVINYINPRVSTGKTEEVKATNNFLQGIPDSLERFFQKLEHLLRHGCLPPGEDPSVEPLPKELQELKGLLEGYRVGDYVLQRNETERYSFSWQMDGKLTVAEEIFYASPAGACSGYAEAGEWRTQAIIQNMEPDLVLQAFNVNPTEKPCQSGLVPEAQSVSDQGESVVTDDARPSAGRVDTTAPAPLQPLTPSVMSATLQFGQQAPRAGLNEAEQTVPAEELEVTDAESTKMRERIEKEGKEILRCLKIQRSLRLQTEIKSAQVDYLNNRDVLYDSETALRHFHAATPSEKESLLDTYKSSKIDNHSYKNDLYLMGAQDVRDYLYRAFVILDLPQNTNIDNSVMKYLNYKFSSELSQLLNSDKEVVYTYPNGTRISLNKKHDVSDAKKVNFAFTNMRQNFITQETVKSFHTVQFTVCVQVPEKEEKHWVVAREDILWWQKNEEKELYTDEQAERLKADLQKREECLEKELSEFEENPEQTYQRYYENLISDSIKKLSKSLQSLEELKDSLIKNKQNYFDFGQEEAQEQEISNLNMQLYKQVEKMESLGIDLPEHLQRMLTERRVPKSPVIRDPGQNW